MTVLIAAGSPEGVALAADGFRRDFNNTYSTNTAQKVWEGQTRDGCAVVFGWTGQTSIAKFFSAFSFADVSLSILRNVHLAEYDGCPLDFVGDFARTIQAKLEAFLDDCDLQMSTAPLAESVASIALGWFARKKPVFSVVTFSRENSMIAANVVAFETEVDDFVCMVSGSLTVYENGVRTIATLQDAIHVARDFAQACVDNRGIIGDCGEYGGHVHVGTVSENGFFWAVPPVETDK